MKAKKMKTYMTPGESGMKDGLSFYLVDETKTDKMMNKIYSMKKPKDKDS
jgi:hypothetical protein